MIEFNSEIDQRYLRILRNFSENIEVNLGSFVADCILTSDRAINLYENKVDLVFNIEKEDYLIFVNDLSIIVSLIETLKRENLIFTHYNPEILHNKISKKPDDPEIYLVLTSDKNIRDKYHKNPKSYGKWELPTTLGLFVLRYIDEFCFVRPELTDYINNGFITKDELRFKTTLRWTYITTIIAFAGLITATILPFCTSTKLEESQLNKILKSTDSIEFSINSYQFQRLINSNQSKDISKDSVKTP